MGISGNFEVQSFHHSYFDSSQAFEDHSHNYEFQPITGIFEHYSDDVWDYRFSNGETISATANHLFYSEDRDSYIEIGKIEIGEKIKSQNGVNHCLRAKRKRNNGYEKVYNLQLLVKSHGTILLCQDFMTLLFIEV